MKKLITITIFVVAILGMPILSQAIPVYIDNAGFETDVLLDGGWQTSITGWTVEGIGGIYNPPDEKFTAGIPEGANVGFINGYSSLYQVLDYVLLANSQLTLSVDVGWRLDGPLNLYEVQLLADGNILASSFAPDLSQGSFVTSIISYSVSASDSLLGSPVAIRFSNIEYGSQVSFDNVSLTNDDLVPTSQIPEPSTLLVLGSGLIAISFLRKKIKK